jgi:hypothetical protein
VSYERMTSAVNACFSYAKILWKSRGPLFLARIKSPASCIAASVSAASVDWGRAERMLAVVGPPTRKWKRYFIHTGIQVLGSSLVQKNAWWLFRSSVLSFVVPLSLGNSTAS